MERRLTAVLIADVVGYGRLSQVDEEGTRARFQDDLHEVFEPTIGRHHGRLVKTMGDGLLVEFHSVVDALRCAVETQRTELERNARRPLDHRMEFRIGINLGDVIVEGDDIHGDGVNIAERIQALAEPGGVAISGTTYDHVKGRLSIGFASLGERKVKSISEPIRVYRILMDPAAAGTTLSVGSRLRRSLRPYMIGAAFLVFIGGAAALALWRPWQPNVEIERTQDARSIPSENPSLVVLPFDNLSDDKEQGYLADGITEDLTTELARIPGLLVISRNAASAYKTKAMQPTQLREELGISYILEGSIRRAGDGLRINAQLIDTASNLHLWAERFDGAWGDVFALQDQVVEKVAASLRLRLVSGPRMAETPGATTVPGAYDLYLQAYALNYGEFPAKAASLLRQAVALDPNFGQAWAELAWVYWTNIGINEAERALGTPHSEMARKIKEYMSEAEKHPSSSYYQVKADVLIWQRKSDEAIANAERAIALDPSDFYGYEEMSLALVFNGRAANAQDYLEAASRVDPQWNAWRYFLAGLIAFCMEQFDDAVSFLEKVRPEELWTDFNRRQHHFILMAAHAHLDHTSEATAPMNGLKAIGKMETVVWAMNGFPFKQREDIERLWEGLSKAGLPDFPLDLEAKNRLTGEEIRSLVFGHELRGRQIDPIAPYVRTTTIDGIANVSVGSSFSSAGTSAIQWDFICTLFETQMSAECSAVFRNPEGTSEKQNEFLWVAQNTQLEFSPVK